MKCRSNLVWKVRCTSFFFSAWKWSRTSKSSFPKFVKIQESNVTGKIGFELPASVTNDFAFTNAKYDFELESPSEAYTGGGNFVIRILYGSINIVKRYSKSDTLLDCSA